ncbi:MAG: winged helix-turn-helix transcriptional regulator [Deltaproteobacteria bacterium]|nr:winged helix-turn-helix transcriptional regulator [Deltaproteobacteria bacterium]
MNKEEIHILRLMGEIDRYGSLSQRELSRRLNISLGLVNTFLKRLVKKGYFKVKTIPRNRVTYLLTPKGVAEKSKLTVEYLKYSINFYKQIKDLLVKKFREMEAERVSSLLFFGAEEVADLAYLYLQSTSIQLVGIIDDRKNGDNFFGFKVFDLERLNHKDWDAVLVTRLDDIDGDIKCLIDKGVRSEMIATLKSGTLSGSLQNYRPAN